MIRPLTHATTRILCLDRPLLGRRTGIGQYLTSLIAHWPEPGDVELVGQFQGIRDALKLPIDRFAFPRVEDIPPIKLEPLAAIQPPARDRTSWLRSAVRPVSEKIYARLIERSLTKGNFAAVFEPNPPPLALDARLVSTLFDLSVIELPETHPADRIRHWQRAIGRAVGSVEQWICISRATSDSLGRLFGVPTSRRTVVPLASRFPEPPDDWTSERLARQLGLPDASIVHLGTIEPRKNLLMLLDAFRRQKSAWRRKHRLILAGAPGWGGAEYWRALRTHPMAAEVLTTGYISDVQVAGALRAARAAVCPSLYEGFGLPPLEAMTLGTPVLISTADALVEVCGSAAPAIPAADADAWSWGLARIVEPGEERTRFIEAGTRRAGQYSWSRTAKLHHDVLLGSTGRVAYPAAA